MAPRSRTTLNDVARRVGVSAKTVSNVVNNTGWVSADTRAKIVAAIEDLGYRPNTAARQLRTGTSGMLALAVPDLREPYFAEFASELVSQAKERQMSVMVTQTKGNLDEELAVLEGRGLPGVDGIILSPLSLRAEHITNRRQNLPVVLIGEHGSFIATAQTPHIGIDNVAAAEAATSMLIDEGCKRIAAVGVQQGGSDATSRLRLEGYRRALSSHALPFDENLLGHVTHFNRAEGFAAARRLVATSPDVDAVLSFNDTLAFGVTSALLSEGFAVPGQVRIIAFDNTDESSYFIPAFSSVDPAMELSASLILDTLAHSHGTTERRIIVPFEIIER